MFGTERVNSLYDLGDAADDAAHPFVRCPPALGINNYKPPAPAASGDRRRGLCKRLIRLWGLSVSCAREDAGVP